MADPADQWVDVPSSAPPKDDGWVDVPPSPVDVSGSIAAGHVVYGAPPKPDIPLMRGLLPNLDPIMSAFGHAFRDTYDSGPTFSQEAADAVRKAGIFKEDSPFEAATEMLASMGASTLTGVQQAFRVAGGVFTGGQAAVAEAGEQIGQPRLGRELAAIPEAFMGSPHPTGIPKAFPEAAGALRPPPRLPEGLMVRAGPSREMGISDMATPDLIDQRAHEIQLIDESGKVHYRGEVTQEGGGLWGIGYVENLSRSYSGLGPSLYREMAAYVENQGGRLIAGMNTNRLSQAVLDGLKEQGLATPIKVGDRGLLEIHSGQTPPPPVDPAAIPPKIAEARELGVIGPPKPDTAAMPPAQAAEAEVPTPRVAAAARTGDETIRGPEPGGPEKAGNIRLDQIGINADAKDVILDAAKQNDDFNNARVGNVPLAQVESLSGASGVPSEVLTANDGLGRLMHNDVVVKTWLQAFHQASDEIAEQFKTVARTGGEADIANLREMKLRFQHMQEQVSGLTAESGRTLNVFRQFYEARGKAEAIGKLLEDNPGNDADSLKKLADTASSLDPRTQLPRYLHDARQPTFWDKYLYYWVNSLISGLITHIKYVGANGAFAGYEAGIVTPIAGALGTARRALGGEGGVYMGEAAARTWGLLAGTPDALRAAWTAGRDNVMTPFPNEVAGKAVNPLTQLRPSAIGGKLGFAIGIPGRSAAGIHSFFRWLGYRAEIEAQAYRAAAQEGLSPLDGDAFWQRRAWHADNPTDEMMKAAIDNGNHLTFISDPGWFGKKVGALANAREPTFGTQPFKLILPFTHIPGQILRAGLEQTPAAFLDSKARADLLGRNGPVAADTARARLVAGGVVSAMVANWALNDSITGYGPTNSPDNPSVRDRWLRTHEPYSVRVGGWWVSYNKFGPIGDLAGLVANLVDVGPNVKDDEYANAAGHVLFVTSRILEDEVGMQGLVNMIEAVGDQQGHKLSRFLSQQTASNLPYSSMQRQIASFNDPYMREAKTFVDELRYSTPWSRQELLPKRDWLGAPMDNPAYESILRQRVVNTDPIDLAISQMSIKPGPPLPRIKNVALPPKLYDEYQAIAGGMTRAALERLVNNPAWHNIPPFLRENIFHSTIRDMRDKAQGLMMMRHKEIWQQGVQDKRDKINGVKPTKLQDQPTP